MQERLDRGGPTQKVISVLSHYWLTANQIDRQVCKIPESMPDDEEFISGRFIDLSLIDFMEGECQTLLEPLSSDEGRRAETEARAANSASNRCASKLSRSVAEL